MIPTIAIALVTAFAGYVVGRIKAFLEGKQRAYDEILPIILRAAYDRTVEDEKALNKAVAKLWLYGNREVAIKIDEALSKMVKPSRGDITKVLQEAIVAMRNDIQAFSYFQRVKAEEVKHLYTRIVTSEKGTAGKGVSADG